VFSIGKSDSSLSLLTSGRRGAPIFLIGNEEGEGFATTEKRRTSELSTRG